MRRGGTGAPPGAEDEVMPSEMAGTTKRAGPADTAVIRPRDAEKTKASILKAAREEFCEQGFNGARVDAIAERAQANKRLLYHYFGNKEALYEAVLLDAYKEIRRGERELHIGQYDPVEAVDRIIRFTFRHFLANPWFPRLLSVENLQNARFVKKIKNVEEIRSPIVGELHEIVKRGHQLGIFRTDVDPMQLYISIISLCYFYVSNMQTLSVVFGKDLSQFALIQDREAQAVQMVLDYLRTKRT
jgi:AcrR family transcriptional regulator